MEKRFERAIVVGASSGIGAALARQLAGQGARVALVARRADQLEQVADGIRTAWGKDKAIVRVHDVSDTKGAAQAFDELVKELGGLDFICYAAGVMAEVGADEYPTDKDLRILEVGLAGAFAWLNPAATFFQAQRKGAIVGIGSIAGDRGRRAYPSYHATKAGFATWLESLRNRLTQHGVRVTTIKPGFIDTAMTRGMPGLFWVKTADEAASMILNAAKKGKQTVYVPARWRFVSLVIRSIPSFLFRRLSI